MSIQLPVPEAASFTAGRRTSAGRWRDLARALLPYLVVVAVCVAITTSLYRVWKIDLSIPFNVDGDAYVHQMLVKNLVESGHFYVNPRLGAPGEQQLYDFPFPNWTHVIIWEILRLFTHNYGVVLNLYFLLSYPLSAITALYALRRFGISTGFSAAGAVLFAFLPFHTMRGESHLTWTAFWAVPMACMVVIWVATGTPLFGFQLPRLAPRSYVTRDGVIALVSCVLIGWDNPYYAFFTASLLPVAGLLGQFRNRHRRAWLAGVLMCATVAAAEVTVLLPNMLYFHQHGRPETARRAPAESETGGLTMIQLLAPISGHRIRAVAHARSYYESHAILVNENNTASLGTLGTVGFLISLASFFRKRCPVLLYSLGICNLWTFLLGTIGGLGAIFAFVISPQLRSYNRVSVFIGFFSIAACVYAVDLLVPGHRSRAWTIASFALIPTILVVIGVLDQIPRHLMYTHASVERTYKEEASFVARIEASLPPGSMVLELPYASFPEGADVNQMDAYKPLMPYLRSKSLRWSYGAMKFRRTDRSLAAISAKPPDQMLAAARSAGFAGIYIDRLGYADRAKAIEGQLSSLLKSGPITDASGRYLFFRIDNPVPGS